MRREEAELIVFGTGGSQAGTVLVLIRLIFLYLCAHLSVLTMLLGQRRCPGWKMLAILGAQNADDDGSAARRRTDRWKARTLCSTCSSTSIVRALYALKPETGNRKP